MCNIHVHVYYNVTMCDYELIFFYRNVLVESARIARGDISPLNELQVKSFDAVVFPGGFGAAKNL